MVFPRITNCLSLIKDCDKEDLDPFLCNMTEKENILGKNILLIGGGSGMGKASAIALSQFGAKVVIAGRKKNNLDSTKLESQSPENILAKESDVTDRRSLDELFSWFDKEVGNLGLPNKCCRHQCCHAIYARIGPRRLGPINQY